MITLEKPLGFVMHLCQLETFSGPFDDVIDPPKPYKEQPRRRITAG